MDGRCASQTKGQKPGEADMHDQTSSLIRGIRADGAAEPMGQDQRLAACLCCSPCWCPSRGTATQQAANPCCILVPTHRWRL